MDLSTYLASLKRFVWVLVIIPVLVGVGTAVWTVHSTPKLHSGTVSIALPLATTAQSESDELADDFSYAASTHQVQDAIAAKAGITRDSLNNHLKVTRVGTTGTIMTVEFDSKSEALAQSVPPAIGLASLSYILGPRIDAAKTLAANLTTASETLTAQQNSIITKAKAGAATPVQASIRVAAAKGTPAYQALSSEQSNILNQASNATTDAATLSASLSTAKTAKQSADATLDTTSSTKTVATRTIANAAAAFLLLLLLLVVVELITGRRPESAVPATSHRATDPTPSGAAPTPAAPVADPAVEPKPATSRTSRAKETVTSDVTATDASASGPDSDSVDDAARTGRATTSLRRGQK